MQRLGHGRPVLFIILMPRKRVIVDTKRMELLNGQTKTIRKLTETPNVTLLHLPLANRHENYHKELGSKKLMKRNSRFNGSSIKSSFFG